MRDYLHLDQYYSELLEDIYPQPPDHWHMAEMKNVIDNWIASLGVSTILDVGCGEGEAQEYFERCGIDYHGVAFGQDVALARAAGRTVFEQDFNFLPYERFDLIFSRHSLEHSPFPLLTLMEWHRIATKWLCLITPNPRHFTYTGRNHYSVLDASQMAWLLRRAGWKIKKVRLTSIEFWFLCEKMPRIGYEGWARTPLSPVQYEFERDLSEYLGEIDVDVYLADKAREEKKYQKWVERMRAEGKL